jgi:hypothetical protein
MATTHDGLPCGPVYLSRDVEKILFRMATRHAREVLACFLAIFQLAES